MPQSTHAGWWLSANFTEQLASITWALRYIYRTRITRKQAQLVSHTKQAGSHHEPHQQPARCRQAGSSRTHLTGKAHRRFRNRESQRLLHGANPIRRDLNEQIQHPPWRKREESEGELDWRLQLPTDRGRDILRSAADAVGAGWSESSRRSCVRSRPSEKTQGTVEEEAVGGRRGDALHNYTTLLLSLPPAAASSS